MSDIRLLVEGHRKFHHGQLRDAAAIYLEYIGNSSLEMRNSVLSQYSVNSGEVRQTLNDMQQVLRRLDGIYDTLEKSATALPITGSLGLEKSADSVRLGKQKHSETTGSAIEPGNAPRSLALTARLPPVPLSTLTRLLILRAHTATVASQKARTAVSEKLDVAHIRRAMEEEQIARDELAKLSTHMHSVETLSLPTWDICSVAREIARIDSRLYSKISFPNDIIVCKRVVNGIPVAVPDVADSVRACAGFAVYLGHAVSGLILDGWLSEITPNLDIPNSRNFSRASSSSQISQSAERRSEDSNSISSNNYRRGLQSLSYFAHSPRIIECLIALADILLRVYGDFNGGISILWALTLPEIRRISGVWKSVEKRTTQHLSSLCNWVGMEIASLERGLSGIGTESQSLNQDKYHAAVHSSVNLSKAHYANAYPWLNVKTERKLLVSVPYMPRHLGNLRRLYSMYTMSHDKSQVLLSAPGVQLLETEKRIFNMCTMSSTPTPESQSLVKDPMHYIKRRPYEPKIYNVVVGEFTFCTRIPTTLSELVDASLQPETPTRRGPGSAHNATLLTVDDSSLQHWILTRAFLTTQMIRSASVSIQPLDKSEEGLVVKERQISEDDLLWPEAMPTVGVPPSNTSYKPTIRGEESQEENTYADNVDAELLPSVEEFLGNFIDEESIELDDNGVPDYLLTSESDDNSKNTEANNSPLHDTSLDENIAKVAKDTDSVVEGSVHSTSSHGNDSDNTGTDSSQNT